MSIQDRAVLRKASDIEAKYNLYKLVRNVEMNGESLTKVENELNNMLNTLIINLKDVLDSQSEVSLWFYSGIPTTTNSPYKDWSNKSDHIGDLYYDQATGYVYKYDGSWVKQEDVNLVSALALTNAELDVSEDHERKVYFSQPIPPYSNGDWWILEDGTLKICQLSKNIGTYETDDFVVSSKYTTTVATKQDDTITVLKGTVLQITEDYVKYTDLGTGGSTQIAGDRITTGSIKSKNYVSGTSGMKIDLDNGTLDSKNLQLDKNGNLNVGGYIESTRGLLTNLQFSSTRNFLGQGVKAYEGVGIDRDSSALSICVAIPNNFEIISAKVTLKTFKTKNTYLDNQAGGEIVNYGKVKNIRLYKETSSAEISNHWYYQSVTVPTGISEISGAFGSSGYTASSTNGEKVESSDIKGSLDKSSVLWVRTGDASLNGETTAGMTAATQQTQYAYAILDVIGYYKIT